MRSQRPAQRAGVAYRRMPDGSAVLLIEATGAAHAINASAADIWELCDGRRDVEEIVAALLARYETTPVEARAATRSLLDHLRSLGALETE